MQGSNGRRDYDSNPGIITQGLWKEEKKDDLSQGDTMPCSFEPVRRESSLPWTEVVGKIQMMSDASSFKKEKMQFLSNHT